MKVVMATSEMVPFAKTGGLADVSGALPKYLGVNEVEVISFLPFYRSKLAGKATPENTGLRFSIRLKDREYPVAILKDKVPGANAPVYFVVNDELFDREELYGTSLGDYEDNASRFILFSRAVLEACLRLGIDPDVFHAHDWQTALIPVYLKTIYRGKFENLKGSLFTIHNLAYQGLFWHWDMELTGLGWEHFNWRSLEFHGKLNFLKGGIVHADAVNTVSPTYSREIQTPEYGAGLHDVLRYHSHKLSGIINGIDYDIWNPSVDDHIYEKFSDRTIANKTKNKIRLQEEMGLPQDETIPVIGMISRLASQKGLDIISEILDELAKENVQLIFLGTGEKYYQDLLASFTTRFPEKISAKIAFSNQLAHRIEAGSDMFLMPSLYEPCGLNQLYSLKYGTLPIVRRTGGLADTIIPATPGNISENKSTGFMFENYSAQELLETIQKALGAYSSKATWNKMVKCAMKQDWSWGTSAKNYKTLYESLG